MLSLILALALVDPAASPSPAVVQPADATAIVQKAVTPEQDVQLVCKWRVHPTGIVIRYCGTRRKWRDEQYNHQDEINFDQRRRLTE